jgi:hypothetical protein
LRSNLAKLGLLAAISGNFDNAGKVRDELANASRSSKQLIRRLVLGRQLRPVAFWLALI